jgi:hypothetical protein
MWNSIFLSASFPYSCNQRSQAHNFLIGSSDQELDRLSSFYKTNAIRSRNLNIQILVQCSLEEIRRKISLQQTPWSTVILEKLRDTQLVKKFTAFYEN